MSNELLEAALAYARDRGWPVFPCNAAKHPYTPNSFYDASTDPKQITQWWTQWPRAGIGFEPGSAGLMALDFDAYKEGFNWTAAAQALGGLPETALVQTTPRGGEHRFYKLDEGEVAASSVSKITGAVDVRSFGGYVLLAPSRTADGAYQWVKYQQAARRTDEMLRVANTARAKSEGRDTWIIEPDLPENVAKAIEWLKTKAKIAVEGQGGDHCAYATAAMMKSFGISEALAFDLLWEHWNPRCMPPWSADEIEHLESKVKHGYAYNTSDPGNCTDAYHTAKALQLFKPIPAESSSGRGGTVGRFRFVDRDAMESIQPPSWLVGDFLPLGGYCLLFGAPGTFKTFVALDIALSVCTGMCVDSLWDVQQCGPVLFTAGEGRAELTKRVTAWERLHYGENRVSHFVLADPVPHVDEKWDGFIAGARELSPDGYKLIVIDTVGRAMQGLNENAQEHASKFTRQVELLQREFGCTVLGLHHTGHDKGTKDRARGSSVFGADADTLVRLDRDGKDTLISLTMTKQKDSPEWGKPRHVKLLEVALSPTVKSLAASIPPKVEVAQAPPPPEKKAEVAEKAAATGLDIIGRAMVEIMEPWGAAKEWSSRQLAIQIEQHKSVENLKASYIEKHLLPELRIQKDYRRYFNAAKGKSGVWRWVE